jgi:hypothetical protein
MLNALMMAFGSLYDTGVGVYHNLSYERRAVAFSIGTCVKVNFCLIRTFLELLLTLCYSQIL